jgi:hypothetical protein
MVISALKQEYDDYVRCEPEVPLDVAETKSEINKRWADVLLEFDETDDLFGQGIVVEIQHKNEEKDIETTTYDYLTKSYSVFWAYEGDFSGNQFHIDRMLDAFRGDDDTGVLAGTTHAQTYAPSIKERTEQETLVSPNQGEDGDVSRIEQLPETDSDGHPVPRIPECTHVFHEITTSSGEGTNNFRCHECGTVMRRSVPEFYFFNPDVDIDNHTRTSLNSDCFGIWKESGEQYECIRCGKSYPRDHDELLEFLTVS